MPRSTARLSVVVNDSTSTTTATSPGRAPATSARAPVGPQSRRRAYAACPWWAGTSPEVTRCGPARQARARVRRRARSGRRRGTRRGCARCWPGTPVGCGGRSSAAAAPARWSLGAPDEAPVQEQGPGVLDPDVTTAGDRVGHQRDRETAEVADVLADGQGAVDVLPGKGARLEPVVLLDQHLRLLLEGGLVVRRPPVLEVAGAVVLRALVVEPVPDLVTDHGADAAVVLGHLRVGAEERLLQDRGGEADLVHARAVVGVDGLREHQPLVAVDRRADLGQLAAVLERVGREDVADEVV